MRTHSQNPGTVSRCLRATFGVLASFLLVASVMAMAGLGDRHEGPAFIHATDAATTDSLRFESDLQADTKPLAAVGQWAYANANGSVARRNYSTNLQTLTQNGGACAYGGNGTSCNSGSSRSDSSVNNRPANWEIDWGGFLDRHPAAYVEFLSDFAADVRCEADGGLHATPPTGSLRYGNDTHVTGNGWKNLNLTSLSNGQNSSDNYHAAGGRHLLISYRDTYVHMNANRRWGTDSSERRAWSEIHVNWVAHQVDRNDDRSHSVTYRSECGVRMNDGSGATTPRSAGFAAADLEPRTTVTVEQDGEESVIEVDPDTGEPLADDPATDQPAVDTPELGEPQAAGFSVESELRNESLAYQLLATRDLSEADLAVVREAVDAATAEDSSARSGEVDGGRWTLFSGGAEQDLPVLEIELADGAAVQVRPDIDGAELPAPDLQGGQR